MHFFFYYIFFLLLNPGFYENIEQKNSRIKEFNQAVEKENFKETVNIFEKIDALHKNLDPGLRLVAAHAYFKQGDTLNARLNYEIIINTGDQEMAASANNQLGILALINADSTLALGYFKNAIKKDNQKVEAKYNYELISSIYTPKGDFVHIPDDLEVEVEASEKKEAELEEYEPENISKERALQLLDNLRVSEKRGLISSKKSNKKVEKDW